MRADPRSYPCGHLAGGLYAPLLPGLDDRVQTINDRKRGYGGIDQGDDLHGGFIMAVFKVESEEPGMHQDDHEQQIIEAMQGPPEALEFLAGKRRRDGNGQEDKDRGRGPRMPLCTRSGRR